MLPRPAAASDSVQLLPEDIPPEAMSLRIKQGILVLLFSFWREHSWEQRKDRERTQEEMKNGSS